jgi:hypothetical protein
MSSRVFTHKFMVSLSSKIFCSSQMLHIDVNCRAADITCKSTFNCQPGKVDLEEPAQEMQD